MIDGITDSPRAVRRIHPDFVLERMYTGSWRGEPELIGYRGYEIFYNAFGAPDRTNYYLVHHRVWYGNWTANFGIRKTTKNKDGLTLQIEIYSDFKSDKSKEPELLVTHRNEINRFRQKDVVSYVESHKSIGKNVNFDFMEAGFPLSLRHKVDIV